MFSRDGSLLPSSYADARSIDAVIVSKAADYDYMGEAKKYAQKFADQLALPETAELMVTLSAALAAAEAAAAAAAAPGGGV